MHEALFAGSLNNQLDRLFVSLRNMGGKAAGLTEKQTLDLVTQQIEKNALAGQASMSPRTKKILIGSVILALIGGGVVAFIYRENIKNWWYGSEKSIAGLSKKHGVSEKELMDVVGDAKDAYTDLTDDQIEAVDEYIELCAVDVDNEKN